MKIEITEVFHNVNCIMVKPIDSPEQYIGTILEHEGVSYEIRSYEKVYYFFGNPPKLANVAFYTGDGYVAI